MEITKTELLFKSNLKNYRECLGKTRSSFARYLNIDKGYYYRLENPKIHMSPTFTQLENIADSLNIPVSVLFKE